MKFIALIVVLSAFAGFSVQADQTQAKKTVVIVFDESDSQPSDVYKNLSEDQMAQGGQLAANARRSIRLANDYNSPIPEEEAFELFDVKPDSTSQN